MSIKTIKMTPCGISTMKRLKRVRLLHQFNNKISLNYIHLQCTDREIDRGLSFTNLFIGVMSM